MSTANSFITRFSNFKGNPLNLGKKDKISSLKTNIIINNTVKTRGNNNSNFLNNKNDLRRGNKRGERFYNKKTIIRIKKYGSLNQINIIKKM